MTAAIAGPDPSPEPIIDHLPPGACDCHAHIFGPAHRFPYAEGRGYTPPDATALDYLALLDRLGCDRGVVVQGNAHGYDNSAILDALRQAPHRLRGVAITDQRASPADLRAWDQAGMRGLRFHLFAPDKLPGYVRGVGLDVFRHFQPTMQALGWHIQVWLDWRLLPDLEPTLREIAARMPVVLDHVAEFDAELGIDHPSFQTLLRLVGDGVCWAKLSAPYRGSLHGPDYANIRLLHQALVRANPEHLVWGTDWPHPSIPPERMPNDGRLLNLLLEWVPDPGLRTQILASNPARLYRFDATSGEQP
jgi:2-pyrone-4,6-dicarboxylate lactonase